jgi:hypothetical protein
VNFARGDVPVKRKAVQLVDLTEVRNRLFMYQVFNGSSEGRELMEIDAALPMETVLEAALQVIGHPSALVTSFVAWLEAA